MNIQTLQIARTHQRRSVANGFASRVGSALTVVTIALAAALATCAGCVSNVDRTREVLLTGTRGSYTAAILAANNITFPSERRIALVSIATAPDIDKQDQIRVMTVVAGNSGFSSDNRDVLIALVSNPACGGEVRDVIGSRLGQMVAFSDDRAAVAEALIRSAGRP